MNATLLNNPMYYVTSENKALKVISKRKLISTTLYCRCGYTLFYCTELKVRRTIKKLISLLPKAVHWKDDETIPNII